MPRRCATWCVPLAAALALAACDEPAPRDARAPSAAPAPSAVPQGRAAEAQRAAEERLRARLRVEGALAQRAIQVHRQALADTLAVCGQVNPSGRGDEPWLPWVAVVTFEGGAARAELHLAASTPEATRVYFEMVDRCFDGGGPLSPRQGIRPLPPAPSDLPRAAGAVQAQPAVQPAPQAPPAPQIVTMPALPAPAPQVVALPRAAAPEGASATTRGPANLRAAPSGDGEVLRVVPRGTTLEILAEAPGGWLQVGSAGEAWGWLHRSLTER